MTWTQELVKMTRTILTDKLWKKLQPTLPPERGYWGRPSRSHREIIEGILWVLRTGAPWRDLPPKFGPWESVYTRFSRWTANGVWDQIWATLRDDIDHENYSIDGSNVKAHQDACRVKKKRRKP